MKREKMLVKRDFDKKMERINYLKSKTFEEFNQEIKKYQDLLNNLDLNKYKDEFTKEQKPTLKRRLHFLIKLATQDKIERAGENIDFGEGVGSCQCGKKIRFGYPVKNELGLSITLGSICIQTLQTLHQRWNDKKEGYDHYKGYYENWIRNLQADIKAKQNRLNPAYNFAEFLEKTLRVYMNILTESWK